MAGLYEGNGVGGGVKALTLHQPWASLVAIGAKDYETRDWDTDYRGPLAIHAGRNVESLGLFEEDPFFDVLRNAGYGIPEDLPLGAVICIATLEDCLSTNGMVPMTEPEASFGNFGPDRFMWKLANVKRFDPIKARGYQKIWDWDVPQDLLKRLFE